MSSKAPNSAFYARLQTDGFRLCELIDLEGNAQSFHWTTANGPITYTLSGVPTVYEPFPGRAEGGAEENIDLSVSVIEFTMANTGSILSALVQAGEMDMATIKIGRVFIDTPDLGRMFYYEGRLGDVAFNRTTLSGQARSKFGSGQQRWPYYNYQDNCAWRFGSPGCGVDVSSHTLTFPVTSINVASSNTLVLRAASGTLVGSFPAGRFDRGRLTVTGGVNSGQIRTIFAHTGDLLSLSHPLAINSFAGITFELFPGCRKRLEADCHSLYNNAKNFLGFPWIPIQEDAF